MRVVVPLPRRDYDPTEVAITWSELRAAGVDVAFATPDGAPSEADDIMLRPFGVGFAGPLLRANRAARAAYRRLTGDAAYRAPAAYASLRASDWDGIVLPGGHRARGMREYLESTVLQRFVADAFERRISVGAICHGVVVAARATSPPAGRSVLYGRKTTALTWALERSAWRVGRIARFWDRDYYRTYVESAGDVPGARSVQAEVTAALASPADFLDVPRDAPDYARKTSGLARDTADDPRPAWVVRDGSYVSARWPGDAHTFARTFAAVLSEAR